MDPEVKAIKAVLKQMSNAYAARDAAALEALTHPEAFVFGTGADEIAKGQKKVLAMVRRDWSQAERTEITFHRPSIHVAGNLAYVASECTYDIEAGGVSMHLPGRTTFVMRRDRGQWRMLQGHFSLPASNQPEGRSFPGQAIIQ